MKKNQSSMFIMVAIVAFIIALVTISSANNSTPEPQTLSNFNTAYADGWHDGYIEGYCDGKMGCIAPLVPLCPLPKVGESINSYNQGWKRGFLHGYAAGH